jgi:hypothetical protein
MIRVVGIHTSPMDLQRDLPHIFQHIIDLLKMVYQSSLTILHQYLTFFPFSFTKPFCTSRLSYSYHISLKSKCKLNSGKSHHNFIC